MKIKTIPEINMTDNPLDNIIKMAPYLDEGSQRTVFGMMLEAVMSIKDNVFSCERCNDFADI